MSSHDIYCAHGETLGVEELIHALEILIHPIAKILIVLHNRLSKSAGKQAGDN